MSSILIPRCSRDWQRYEKELEVKSELTRNVSKSTGSLLVALKNASDPFVFELPGYDDDLLNRWELDGQMLASEFQLYFPDSGLSSKWLRYVETLTSCYDFFLQGAGQGIRRKQLVEIERALGVPEETQEDLRPVLTPMYSMRHEGPGRGESSATVPGSYLDARTGLFGFIERERDKILETLFDSRSAL